MVERENIFPEGLSKRIVGGHLLYAPVVTVVPGKLVFISGLLSRNSKGDIVGKGDMRRQIQQVCENLRTALAGAGATMADVCAGKPSPPTSMPSSSTSTRAWNISAMRSRPARPSRCAGSRIPIFWSRSRPSP